MPKKFKGENSKAAEAKARKESALREQKERIDKEKEDALWEDNDKHNAVKQKRKEEKEKKRLEQLERKKELQQLHDEEMSSIKGCKQPQASKVTRATIQANQEKIEAEAKAAKLQTQLSHTEVPLEENTNRLEAEGEARTVEDAIAVLSVKDSSSAVDMHPEKRVKAAYAAFEEIRLPVLKKENPNMRLSQLKQILKKEWQKSPDNPLNQRHRVLNS